MNKYHGKPCKKCGEALRYTRNHNCVECQRVRSLRWSKANPEKERASSRKWTLNNRNKRRASSRKWNAANLESVHTSSRKWKRANPEYNQRRRANIRQVQSEYYDFKSICEHYGNRCLKCGEKKPLTIDHIQPISKGGSNITSNIQPLCGRCNSIKGTKIIDYRPDAGPLRWIQNKLFGG